jgi:hypothetical protein
MNRAAERAAPEAQGIFLGAIREMTLEDGRKILTGGDTAATYYFKTKTAASLTAAFRPIVVKAMKEAEITRRHKQLTGGIPAMLFAKQESFNIDDYVFPRVWMGCSMSWERKSGMGTDCAHPLT